MEEKKEIMLTSYYFLIHLCIIYVSLGFQRSFLQNNRLIGSCSSQSIFQLNLQSFDSDTEKFELEERVSLKKLEKEQLEMEDLYVRPERQKYLRQQRELEETVKKGALLFGGFLALGTLGMVYVLKEGIITVQ